MLQNFGNRIINGDCLTVLPQLPDGSVDFVLTDPPYLVSYRDRQGRSLAGDDSAQWLKPAFAEIFRVLKPGRFCVSFYGWNRVDQFMAAWRAAGFTPVGHLVWVKDYASSRGLLAYRHESAYLLAKGSSGTRTDMPLPDVLAWQYTGNRLHPTQKPVPALKPVIEAFSKPGEVVLDPFCGSGSTLLASVDLQIEPREVHVYLTHDDLAAWPCPECGAASKPYDHQKERQWRHLDTCQYRTILHAEPPRSQCPAHGVRVVKLPWAEPSTRFTALFEALAIAWLRAASQKAVGEQLGLSWDEIHGIMERAVKRGLERRQGEQGVARQRRSTPRSWTFTRMSLPAAVAR